MAQPKITSTQLLTGVGSGLDADTLDGVNSSTFQDASNLTTGTLPSGRLSGTYSIDISGNAATATTANSLGGVASSLYALLASPAFTGNPTCPTPATSDNDTSIASTAFVRAAITTYAPAGVTIVASNFGLSSGYVNFSNGLQFVWERAAHANADSIVFLRSFTYVPIVIGNCETPPIIIGPSSVSITGFTIGLSTDSGIPGGSFSTHWMAIGYRV